MRRLREYFAPASRRTLLFSSGWLFADRILRIAVGLLVNVALARHFGPAGFGSFVYALTLAALFLPLATLGLERVVVRELANRGVSESATLGSAGLARLVGGVIGWLMALIVVALSPSDARAGSAVLVALVTAGNVFLAFDVIDWSFQARGNFQTTTIARLIAFLAGAATKLVLVRRGADLAWIAAIVLAEAAFSAVLQTIAWRRSGGQLSDLHFDRVVARHLLKAGLPLLAADVAVWLFQKLDVIILDHAGTAKEVGIYSVAVRLAQAAFFLPGLAVQLFSPAVAQAPGRPEAVALVQRIMFGLVALSLVLAVGLTVAGPYAVRLLFGSAYWSAGPLVQILAWSNVFVFMGSAHGLYLVNRKSETLMLKLNVITACVSVSLNLLLIPRFQAMGAAIANLATYGLAVMLGVGLFEESRPLFLLNLRVLAWPVLLVVRRFRPRV